ncbi:MAG: hypothetical protein H6667_02305 [Ardenticatenaceae bacterium]|nr:hypothetical protein [Ardenticatenaceae bacterium]MCB9443342.1 hypothetical protein [Ardenticatenaceae bacterium]
MEIQQFEEQLSKGPVSLKVTNEIGSITIVPGSDDIRTIHVDAESRGMIITVSRSDNTVTVRAEREEAWRNPIEQIRGLFTNEHPEAHLTIQVPVDCDVNAKMITGSLSISGIDGVVNGRTVTGSAKLTNLGGPINAKTVTGKLSYNGRLSDDIHHFKTVTGAVKLNLAHLPNARLDARTDVGGIHYEFLKGTATSTSLSAGVTTQNMVGSRLQDVLGSGQGHIKIRVATGSIHLNHIVENEGSFNGRINHQQRSRDTEFSVTSASPRLIY